MQMIEWPFIQYVGQIIEIPTKHDPEYGLTLQSSNQSLTHPNPDEG